MTVAFSGVAATVALGSQGHAERDRMHAHRSHPVRSHSAPRARTASPRAHESIVGGAAASIDDFPFQVALYNPNAGAPSASFFCGGVIIDATHVATAAHCIVSGPHGIDGALGEIEVLAGSTRLAPTDPGSVRDPIIAASVDAGYSPSSSELDVGLLTLAHPLWSGITPSINGVNTIAPLPVDAERATSYASSQLEQAVVGTVSGWGDIFPSPADSPSYPVDLRSAHVPLVSQWQCEEDYARIAQQITPQMICAGNSRRRSDSCYGDSGGPLIVDSDSPANPPSDYVLVGLVDFGNGCAQPGYPGVYTRIGNPEVASFLVAGVNHEAALTGKQSRKKRHRRRHH